MSALNWVILEFHFQRLREWNVQILRLKIEFSWNFTNHDKENKEKNVVNWQNDAKYLLDFPRWCHLFRFSFCHVKSGFHFWRPHFFALAHVENDTVFDQNCEYAAIAKNNPDIDSSQIRTLDPTIPKKWNLYKKTEF